MISERVIIDKFKGFADSAMPILNITNEEAYGDALHLLETLLDNAGDNETCPEQYLITILSYAITDYENNNKEALDFLHEVNEASGEIAVLKTLIEQHNLTLDLLPEIGHKSLVSKILSGERQLTKKHIQNICERFKISPSLFF